MIIGGCGAFLLEASSSHMVQNTVSNINRHANYLKNSFVDKSFTNKDRYAESWYTKEAALLEDGLHHASIGFCKVTGAVFRTLSRPLVKTIEPSLWQKTYENCTVTQGFVHLAYAVRNIALTPFQLTMDLCKASERMARIVTGTLYGEPTLWDRITFMYPDEKTSRFSSNCILSLAKTKAIPDTFREKCIEHIKNTPEFIKNNFHRVHGAYLLLSLFTRRLSFHSKLYRISSRIACCSIITEIIYKNINTPANQLAGSWVDPTIKFIDSTKKSNSLFSRIIVSRVAGFFGGGISLFIDSYSHFTLNAAKCLGLLFRAIIRPLVRYLNPQLWEETYKECSWEQCVKHGAYGNRNLALIPLQLIGSLFSPDYFLRFAETKKPTSFQKWIKKAPGITEKVAGLVGTCLVAYASVQWTASLSKEKV